MPDQAEPEGELSFEQALAQLQRIVETLERGESDLSSALSQYERSVTLLGYCNRLLDQAEQSVALLSGVDPQGNPITTPFDATATIAREPDPGASETTPSPEPKPSKPARTAARKVRATPEVDAVDPLDPPF
ncbi:MAG TPA: exodeoxyribonuclease VII small subunit [Isosphaeraceae bacterium]|nr:exodeoxyribonuclease VII small subunit [Isosphaeraceae bacterium]